MKYSKSRRIAEENAVVCEKIQSELSVVEHLEVFFDPYMERVQAWADVIVRETSPIAKCCMATMQLLIILAFGLAMIDVLGAIVGYLTVVLVTLAVPHLNSLVAERNGLRPTNLLRELAIVTLLFWLLFTGGHLSHPDLRTQDQWYIHVMLRFSLGTSFVHLVWQVAAKIKTPDPITHAEVLPSPARS